MEGPSRMVIQTSPKVSPYILIRSELGVLNLRFMLLRKNVIRKVIIQGNQASLRGSILLRDLNHPLSTMASSPHRRPGKVVREGAIPLLQLTSNISEADQLAKRAALVTQFKAGIQDLVLSLAS